MVTGQSRVTARAAVPVYARASTLDPAIKGWIDSVLVPAMVKTWADTNAFERRAIESLEAN
jgi:hypothetical protein